jgi:hypothetical protein
MRREPLYRRVVGEGFDRLHPVLRRFHESPQGGRGAGVFRVQRAPGRWHNLVADAMGLPQQADAVRVELNVVPCGGGERWLRTFDGRPLRTRQSRRGRLLVEEEGPVAFGLEVAEADGGMTFRTRKVWVCGLPVPAAWVPAVAADVVPDDAGWTVDVTVQVPLLGLLVRYGGRLTPS